MFATEVVEHSKNRSNVFFYMEKSKPKEFLPEKGFYLNRCDGTIEWQFTSKYAILKLSLEMILPL